LHHPSRRQHVHNSPPGRGFENFDQSVAGALHFNPGIISKAHYHAGACTGKKPFAAKFRKAFELAYGMGCTFSGMEGRLANGEFTALEILF
jgi:hypothetical protein